MKRKHIYVGDYVRLKESYLIEWLSEKSPRLEDLRDTIFIVIDTCWCYKWAHGVGGGGELLSLKPFFGPLSGEDIILGRGDSSVELLEPSFVDDIMKRASEE